MTEGFDPTRIRAVAFDGYGTLFHFGMPEFRVEIVQILAECQAQVDLDAFFTTWQRSYGVADVWEHPPRTETDPPTWPTDHALNGPLPDWHSQWEIWRRQFHAACNAHQVDGDPTFAADRFRHALSHAPAYPDAYETVEGLAGRGRLVGLLSNADEDFIQSAISRARLRFSVIQSSESLRAYKPNRAIFIALAGRLGVEPSEVLYVGDSPFADVAGARNAGLSTAWIQREEAPFPAHLQPADVTITNLRELLDIIPPQ